MLELEDAVDSLADAEGFSGAVRVDRGDDIALAKAYGFAHRGYEIRNAVDTQFAQVADKLAPPLPAGQMLYVSLLVELLRSRPGLLFWGATLAQALLWTLVPARLNTMMVTTSYAVPSQGPHHGDSRAWPSASGPP